MGKAVHGFSDSALQIPSRRGGTRNVRGTGAHRRKGQGGTARAVHRPGPSPDGGVPQGDLLPDESARRPRRRPRQHGGVRPEPGRPPGGPGRAHEEPGVRRAARAPGVYTEGGIRQASAAWHTRCRRSPTPSGGRSAHGLSPASDHVGAQGYPLLLDGGHPGIDQRLTAPASHSGKPGKGVGAQASAPPGPRTATRTPRASHRRRVRADRPNRRRASATRTNVSMMRSSRARMSYVGQLSCKSTLTLRRLRCGIVGQPNTLWQGRRAQVAPRSLRGAKEWFA
jgi:hypothetical protein